MRDLPPVARRMAMLGLASGLLISILPSGAIAQDTEPVLVEDAFTVSGDAGLETAIYRWRVNDDDGHWSLEAIPAEEGEWVRISVHDDAGEELDRSTAHGRAALFDLGLAAGDYEIWVHRSGDDVEPFVLTSLVEAERLEPEPNDSAEQAVPIDLGGEIRGRLARISSDIDYYRLVVPPGEVGLRDINLESESDIKRELCLWSEGERIQCRSGSGSVLLPDLLLEPGDHLLEVRGSRDEAGVYRLAVGEARPRPVDGETEPNDTFATASTFEADTGVRARSQSDDPDFHVVTIEDEPQLWQIRAWGPQIAELGLVRGQSGAVAESNPRADGSDAVIDDLILAPGQHVFRVRSFGDEYSLEMTPLGLPDPSAEREPNNDDTRAQAYGIGERVTGRLATAEDYDYYRFTLAAPERFRLGLEQPADADLDITITGAGREALRHRATAPGEAIDLDVALPPGDYLVRLYARQPSEGTYALTTERLDPGAPHVDQEPNADVRTAQPAPPSLVFTGDQAAYGADYDWFALPPLSVPSTVTIHHSDARPGVWLFAGVDGDEKLKMERIEDGLYAVADVPADTPLYLELQADGPYEARLEAEGWTTFPDPAQPPLDMTAVLEHETVAAYWPQGQRVAGSVVLTNTGPDDLELELEASTSHYAWTAAPAVDTIAIAAGATTEVPIEVLIGPDAWAKAPVQVTVSAVAPDGGRQAASVELAASRDVVAVDSRQAWPVPEALLGGLNVAGLALGGEPLGTIDADREPALFDDVTPTGAGFTKGLKELPAELVVDLAGDLPLPIVGTILNPLAQHSKLHDTPLRFELLLSTDGEAWTSVLDEELSPLPIDQAFVLDEAVEATYAMLRLHSMHGAGGKTVSLGEWKVVAEPGAVPEPMPANIAAPIRGGHVARHAPYSGSYSDWVGMLDEETKRHRARFDPETEDELEIIVGFQEGRAAQITGLRWLDPDGSDESTRVDGLEVEVGLDGPLGPWQSVGSWVFDRGSEGLTQSYELETPTWARFVRLTAPLPTEQKSIEFPATIEVLERAPDGEYRSILGEWGYTSDRGPFEWSVSRVVESATLDPDAGDTAALATPLALDLLRTDQAQILEDDDWYRVSVPAGANTLTFDLEGLPTVGVRLTLYDDGEEPLEMPFESLPDGSLRYEATVEPGDYLLRVEQPPFNVVFTFDTSGSMGPFLDFVLEGMREFAADVEPGREVVQVIPVSEEPLLEEWTDQPIHIENAVNNFEVSGDAGASNIEEGLLAAAGLLAERDGTRAILAVADAETGSLQLANDVWKAFDQTQPVVYTVHVGASGRPEETRNLMRAWSDSNGGVYTYPTTHAEMERAFERMSTHLRRPSTYTITASTEFIDLTPGTLEVVAPEGQPVELAEGTGLALILDTSGSMNKRLDGERRIDIAKASMKQLVKTGLAEGAPVSLRIFGGTGKKTGCETRQLVELGPLDTAGTVKLINKLKIQKNTGTPIAAALRWVKRDLEDVEGRRIVVLITDGKATCKADPEEALVELRDEGIEVSLNIVGFALDDEAVKEQMRGWAEANGGSFFDAASADALTEAVKAAVAPPVDVYAVDDRSTPVASTTVGGEAVELEPGEYVLQVRSDPPLEIEGIVLAAGENKMHELEVPGANTTEEESTP